MANSRFAVATHIMLSVAIKKDELVNSVYLSSSVNTNPVVVRRILSDLQKAGLLETFHGRNGGARLARPAKQISLHQIFLAVDEEELFAYNPAKPNRTCELSTAMKAILEPVFSSATKAMSDNLKETHLSDLVERLSKSCQEKGKGLDGSF